MAQTISELEKERAELLKAIEDQAQQMSTSRTPGDGSEHTLNDWLNAAEEVMPSKPKKKATPPPPPAPQTNNRASFFGVVIMLSLLLTILGVMYIGYTSIHNELQKVLEVKEDSMKEVKLLKETVSELQASVASGGQGELFTEMQKRVEKLEAEIVTLKAQQASIDNAVIQQAKHLEKVQNGGAPIQSVPIGSLPTNVVTTEILEAKLQEYTQGIDAKLETILKHMNIASVNVKKPAPKVAAKPAAKVAKVSVHSEPEQADQTIAEPSSPAVKEPTVKPLNQPVVRLVQKVEAPKEPNAKKPLINYSPDVKWLMDEPAFNFTLQLASMSDRRSVQKMVEQKKLTGARIIPQTRKDETNYVLVTGSYKSRTEANRAAEAYKSNFGISPWVRKVKDITRRIQ